MPTHSLNCPDCGRPIEYWQVHCRCGHFVGFPNRREAEAERADLLTRYRTAQTDAAARRVSPLLQRLEQLAQQSCPVIAMPFAACDDLLRSGKYRNYEQRLASSERDPASREDHANREMVGAKLYPTFNRYIQYAALSPDGRGLPNYGPIAVRWRATPEYLGRRSSLLESNSFIFFEQFSLGRLSATIPPGYRAVWEDRAKLTAAKLAHRLTTAMNQADLLALLIQPGSTRSTDDFVEIAIYADRGLDTQDVDMITIQRPPARPDEHHRLDLIREACASRPIVVV